MADNYTVVSQRPVTEAGPGQQFVPAVEIAFTTKPNNQPGRVRVPESQYTADHVHDVLSNQAALIEAIQTL